MREDVIKTAVEQNLSGMYMTNDQKMAVLHQIREEKNAPRMRLRFSAVLVAALLLILLAAGAVAAVLLGGKDFTKEVVAPMAMKTESESFTAEEVGEILRLAEENGITVPQYVREHWAKWGSEYKEELMRALVKTELGFYPASWSLDDQNWYNRMLVECGLADSVSSLVPGEDDFTEEKVLYMANTLFREKLGLDGDLTDETQYCRFLTFGIDTTTPGVTFKQWCVEYEDLKTGAQYAFVMLDNGLVTRVSRYQPDAENPYISALTEEDVVASFRQYFGDSVLGWNMEVLEQFYHSFAMCDHTKQAADPGVRHVAQTRYLMPGGHYTYMTEEEAVALARKACKADEGLQPYVIYFGDDPNNMHWKISFWEGTEKNKQFRLYAQIDGKTGETEYAGIYDGPWYEPLVNAADHASVAEDKTIRVYEKPAMWRSPLFSDAYWDALEALDYNAETREQRIEEWSREYGEHTNLWPYAHQAVHWWWDMNPKFDVHNYWVPGIPVEGEHISMEEAKQIALNRFMEEAPALFTEEELARLNVLPPSFDYHVIDGEVAAHVWYFDLQIEFDDGRYSDSLFHIDAHTGEILMEDISNAAGNG